MTAAEAPTGRRALTAGPLTVDLDEGGLRYVRLGDREILRRVYVAVRDAGWATVPMTIADLSVEAGPDAFTVELVAEHREGAIHFRWKGTIRGEASGTIRFEMDGEALTTFKRNRIGICVLHPIETCAGLPCRVRHVDGGVEDGAFPRLVAPHQPFLQVQALSYEVEPGTVAEVRLEGEEFETEDQRNWCDFSFKTYGTRLELSTPVEVPAGTRLRQAVTLRLVPEAIARRAPAPKRSEAVDFAVTDEPGRPLPALGTTLSARAEPFTERERALLAALHLAHLRVDLVPSRDDFPAAFAGAVDAARALALPLELALWLTPAPAAELEAVERALAQRRPPLALVLALPLARDVTSPEAVAAVRAVVPGVTVAGGTNVHFTELNRNRAVAAVADALLFPSCPTVHMVDDTTVAENLGAIPWIAETAADFFPRGRLGLSPVVLRKPTTPPPRFGGEVLAPVPRYVDPRQSSLFAAAWTAAHAGRAARAGFERLTYFQATGARGLMAGEAGPPLPAALAAEPGAVFPVYHVLAALGERAGGTVLATRSSAPLEVDGIAVRRDGQTRLLLANLTRAPRSVKLPAALRGGRVSRLEPTGFREASGGDIVLGPHALARIDADE